MSVTRLVRALAAATLVGVLTSAQALTVNPPIRMAQGIEYMCGGKNRAEATFMQTVSPRWAATLEFAVNRAKTSEVPFDIKVVVRERYSGKLVMEASAGAPFMLARLDPGAYEIEATLGGLTLQQPLVVFNGLPAKATFVWPSNIDFAQLEREGLPQRQVTARSAFP